MEGKDKELIRLFREHGSYEEVAKRVNLSYPTVRKRLNGLGYDTGYSLRYGKPEVKLIKTAGRARLVSLAYGYLSDLGYKEGDRLAGSWSIRDGKLVLDIRKVKS